MKRETVSGDLRIGQVAKLGGVNLQTIRYYEREGLILRPPRLPSGYRVFSIAEVRRVRFIKRAQELGFSLKEIRELLSFQNTRGEVCAGVRNLARLRVADVENKIRNLRAMKKALGRLAAACPGKGSIGDCPIIDSLNGNEGRR